MGQTLIAALAYDYPNVRWAMATGLGQLRLTGPEVVSALMEILKDSDNDVRQAAADRLARLFAGERETVLRTLLPVFFILTSGQPDKYDHRPGHDYAFDALWVIAGH